MPCSSTQSENAEYIASASVDELAGPFARVVITDHCAVLPAGACGERFLRRLWSARKVRHRGPGTVFRPLDAHTGGAGMDLQRTGRIFGWLFIGTFITSI